MAGGPGEFAPSSMTKSGIETVDFAAEEARSLLSAIRSSVEASYERTRAMVTSLGRFVESLAGFPGRKVIFYVGNGVPMRPGESLLVRWENRFGNANLVPGFSAALEASQTSLASEFRSVIARANADRVMFYAIDARGGAALRGPTAEQAVLDPAPDTNVSEELSKQQSLQYLTSTTGGTTIAPAWVKVRSARRWIADIGLEGKKAKHDGQLTDAYYFCVGGSVGKYAGAARPVGFRTPAHLVPEAVERLLRRYLAERESGENLRAYFARTEDADLRAALARSGGGPVLVCGSTVDGEEAVLLRPFQQVLERFPGAVIVLAPRHPERFARVAGLLTAAGIRFWRRSQWDSAGADLHRGAFLRDSLRELGPLLARPLEPPSGPPPSPRGRWLLCRHCHAQQRGQLGPQPRLVERR